MSKEYAILSPDESEQFEILGTVLQSKYVKQLNSELAEKYPQVGEDHPTEYYNEQNDQLIKMFRDMATYLESVPQLSK